MTDFAPQDAFLQVDRYYCAARSRRVVRDEKRGASLVPGRRKRKVSLRPEGGEKSQKRKVISGSWARLLKRVFAIDVSRCPRCKSDLEIIAAVLDRSEIARYLKHTGMAAAPPSRAGVKMRVVCDEWC